MNSAWTARLNGYQLGKVKECVQKKISCPYCSLAFSNQGGMQRHVNATHPWAPTSKSYQLNNFYIKLSIIRVT